MEGGNNNITGLSCTILYIPSTYFAYSMCTLLSFLIQKTQKYLVKWEKGRGGMLPPSCTYTEQPEEFSFLHTCDLASIRIFLSLSCLPTSFLHSPGQQLSLLHFSSKNIFVICYSPILSLIILKYCRLQ